jgi:hypothetical protein
VVASEGADANYDDMKGRLTRRRHGYFFAAAVGASTASRQRA